MKKNMLCRQNRVLRQLMLLLGLLPTGAMAWYGGPYPAWQYPPNYGYAGWPGYPAYFNGYSPYAYREPRWYFRGRMDRYGNYDFVFRMKNINLNDLYDAWLWYQYQR
jgi:hypothetical protein